MNKFANNRPSPSTFESTMPAFPTPTVESPSPTCYDDIRRVDGWHCLAWQIILLVELYDDRGSAGRHACDSLPSGFPSKRLPISYWRYLDATALASVERVIVPLAPASMPDSMSITAPPSAKRPILGHLPDTYRLGPIFGGRTISTMGSRPQDHMDRDLLLASLLRDRRLRMFRKQCHNLPEWAPAVPESIPAKFQARARQLIMLGSTQQYLIERMRNAIHLAADCRQGEQMLKAMENCLPRGALFARTTPDPGRACGYARLCPWCHARSVQRLYRQLLEGSCTPERLAGKHLIALRTRVDGGKELQPREVRTVRDEYRYRLRELARKVGIEGGVIIHQVTPWVPYYDRPHEKRKIFAHIFSMIGVVPSSVAETLGEALGRVCIDLMLDGDGNTTAMLPGETPQALRYLLFGSSYKFDSSELGLAVTGRWNLQYGIQGAAALEPWFLFDQQQAWSYAAAMRDTRLYDTFGNWRESQAGRQQCSRKRRAKSEYGNEDRQAAFAAENSRRSNDANARREQLAAQALPYYQSFKDAGGKHLGSLALRKVLANAGYTVSDRDARWLAKHLPTMDVRSGFEKFVAKRKMGLASDHQVCCQVAE